MPISVLVWVYFYIEPDVFKTMYRSTIHCTTLIYLINLLWKLGIGFRLDSELLYFSLFTENKESEHFIFREFHGR